VNNEVELPLTAIEEQIHTDELPLTAIVQIHTDELYTLLYQIHLQGKTVIYRKFCFLNRAFL
jgi:hypothetical protein